MDGLSKMRLLNTIAGDIIGSKYEFNNIHTKDFELWVDNGRTNPEKLTFGRILKLTGVNRIPLRRIAK